jgi:predicted RNA-binding protein YlxR (DUF448 family)
MVKKGPRPKHVPQRTCVACRTTGAKRGLVRVVRTPDGQVVLDETGKKSGRGAYLCKARDCWNTALKRKLLEYALKVPVTIEDKQALQDYAATLPERTEEEKREELILPEPTQQEAPRIITQGRVS